jgi:hypothetical protein
MSHRRFNRINVQNSGNGGTATGAGAQANGSVDLSGLQHGQGASVNNSGNGGTATGAGAQANGSVKF